MNARAVKAYMYRTLNDNEHIDGITGEVMLTGLAEDAAAEFEAYDENDNIIDEIFELAYEVGEEWEASEVSA